MIRAQMRAFICVGVCLAVVCAAGGAHAQSDSEVTAETSPGIEAVDASVHPEVDGQPHEPTAQESSRERPNASHAAKRPSATVFWPAHADISGANTDDKTASPKIGMSAFRPETASGRPNVGPPDASAPSSRAKENDSGQSQTRLLRAPFSHLSGDAKPSSTLRTRVPSVFVTDETQALGAGRPASGLVTSGSPFPKGDSFRHQDKTTGKRHQHHARKPVIPNPTKSSSSIRLSDRHTALALSSK